MCLQLTCGFKEKITLFKTKKNTTKKNLSHYYFFKFLGALNFSYKVLFRCTNKNEKLILVHGPTEIRLNQTKEGL